MLSQSLVLIREVLVTFLECDSGITGEALAAMSHLTRTHPRCVVRPATELATCLVRLTGLLLMYHLSTPLLFSLNLAVVASLEEANVHNMVGVVNQLLVFFCSP